MDSLDLIYNMKHLPASCIFTDHLKKYIVHYFKFYQIVSANNLGQMYVFIKLVSPHVDTSVIADESTFITLQKVLKYICYYFKQSMNI